ncbi:MAG: alcohol dehydrogenase catalytic domain-containing protein [Terracidiphilus sp.]
MLAARYLAPNQIEPVDVPLPALGENEALVKVEACGFCGSDLSIVAGVHPRARGPLTLGHEFCGTITDINSSSSSFQRGDFVTAIPLISCGQCYACRNGMPHVCRTLKLYGFDVDGAMAEFVRLPVSSLLKLPPTMSSFAGAVIEPLAVAVHGVSLAPIDMARTAVIMGAGPIGLLTALVAKSRDVPTVLISDVLPFRLALARKLGLRAVAAGEELRNAVIEETSGDGSDLVFECAGNSATGKAMTELVRSRGTIVNLGVFKRPVEIDMQAVNFKEIILRGSRVYTRRDFESAIHLAENIPVREVVTHSFPLIEVQAAFDCFRNGADVCKVLIVPNEARR